tara:strand:+ start:195 stop:845 length:651 start_codon:yes stop_codon:yes gene_type:complete
MKITKNRLREIIKEELQRVLGEGDLRSDQGSTIYGPRAGDMSGRAAARLRRNQEAPAADTDPEKESERLFNVFFPGYDEYATELLVRSDPELKEILGSLIGWKFKNLDPFPPHRGVRPVSRVDLAARTSIPRDAAIKVAQQFENEGKRLNREDDIEEFYKLLGAELSATARKKFTQSRATRPDAGSAKMAGASYPGTREDAELRSLLNISELNTDK